MVKKLIFGLIGIIVVGLLVYGGIYRSNFKLTGDLNPPGISAGNGLTRGGQTDGMYGAMGENGGQRPGWGNGGRTTAGLEWASLEGKVTAVDETSITILAANGVPIQLENRPWQYALSTGFTAKVGDVLKLTGFYETPEVFTAAQIQNLTSGKNVVLRDNTGRPMWSGRNSKG